MPLSKYSTMAKEITKATSEQASVAGVGTTPSDFEHLHLDEDSDAEPLVAREDALDAEQIITDQVWCQVSFF